MATLFIRDLNPFSINPYARPIDIIQAAKWLMKFVITFFYTFDSEGSVNK